MVEFCHACKSSLPKADTTFRAGRSFVTPGSRCPFCNAVAPSADVQEEMRAPEPDESTDVVFSRGSTAAVPPEASTS